MTNKARGARYCLEFHKGSILGTLLFNIFKWNIFYFLEDFDITNYVDDSKRYFADKTAELLVSNLEQSSPILDHLFQI